MGFLSEVKEANIGIARPRGVVISRVHVFVEKLTARI
jgi:hypothetical protein